MLMNSPLPRGGLGTLRESTTMRSIRDRDSVGNAWKTTNTNAAQLAAVVETVNRQGRTINKLRRRVPTLIQPPAQVILPFTVYNIGNVLNGVDSWRTFQMRNGLIGFRPKFVYPGGFNPAQGNFEVPTEVFQDGVTDFSAPAPIVAPPAVAASQQVILANDKDTQISGYDANNNPVGFYQFLPDDTWDSSSGSDIMFSVWAEIIDVKNSVPEGGNPYANLWARMFTYDIDDGTGRPTVPFPNAAPNIFPICYATLEGNLGLGGTKATAGTWMIHQLQIGNLINRYPQLIFVNGRIIGTPCLRGWWKADSLAGQIIYPGDLVVDDRGSIVNGDLTLYMVLIYQGSIPWAGDDSSFDVNSSLGPGYDWSIFSTIVNLP